MFADEDFVHDLIDTLRDKGWDADRDFVSMGLI